MGIIVAITIIPTNNNRVTLAQIEQGDTKPQLSAEDSTTLQAHIIAGKKVDAEMRALRRKAQEIDVAYNKDYFSIVQKYHIDLEKWQLKVDEKTNMPDFVERKIDKPVQNSELSK